MTDIIAEAARRTRGYRFVDGLFEIGGGILFMVLSIPYLIWSLAPQGSKLASLASNGRDVILLAGIVLLIVVVWVIKQRSTYPRSGYVEELRPGRRRIMAASIISSGLLIFAGLLAASILLSPTIRLGFLNIMYYFPTILGFFLALVLIAWRVSSGIKRFYMLAGVAVLASLGLAAATRIYLAAHPFDWSFLTTANSSAKMPAEAEFALEGLFSSVYRGAAILAACLGLAMLVSGLIVRRKYMRENPIPQEEAK